MFLVFSLVEVVCCEDFLLLLPLAMAWEGGQQGCLPLHQQPVFLGKGPLCLVWSICILLHSLTALSSWGTGWHLALGSPGSPISLFSHAHP